MAEEKSHPMEGRLAENIVHFARTLRRAGLKVPPGAVLDALKAVEIVGFSRREEVYATLRCLFVTSHEEQAVFDQCFHIFWRNPELLERAMSLMLPSSFLENLPQKEKSQALRRVQEAFAPQREQPPEPESDEQEEIEFDARLTQSEEEVLRHKDFEQMSQEEQQRALRLLAALRLPREEVLTRRFRPHPAGRRIDARRTFQASLRLGGDVIQIQRHRRQRRRPPLVVLCDISGSMSHYSRLLLHFIHTLTEVRDRVHSFVFGTRLTNITHLMRHADVDAALQSVGQQVEDWSGGTRISSALHAFNQHWSRRVLGQGANVLLITDGLEREGEYDLAREMDRLHRSCRRLIWLNPLLRYDAFEPKARGIRLMLPHVDDFRSAHSLASLEDLVDSLQDTDRAKRPPPTRPGFLRSDRKFPEKAFS